MVIPLKSDKSVDVYVSGYNPSSGNIMKIKIIAISYLKDCNTNCL